MTPSRRQTQSPQISTIGRPARESVSLISVICETSWANDREMTSPRVWAASSPHSLWRTVSPEHRRGPAVQRSLDDAERRIECGDQVRGAEHMLEVVVARAVVRRVREGRRLGAGLAGDVAQAEHPLAREMADGRPEGPTPRTRLDRQLLVGQRRDDIAQLPVVEGPPRVGEADRGLGHAANDTGRAARDLSRMAEPSNESRHIHCRVPVDERPSDDGGVDVFHISRSTLGSSRRSPCSSRRCRPAVRRRRIRRSRLSRRSRRTRSLPGSGSASCPEAVSPRP